MPTALGFFFSVIGIYAHAIDVWVALVWGLPVVATCGSTCGCSSVFVAIGLQWHTCTPTSHHSVRCWPRWDQLPGISKILIQSWLAFALLYLMRYWKGDSLFGWLRQQLTITDWSTALQSINKSLAWFVKYLFFNYGDVNVCVKFCITWSWLIGQSPPV